MHDSIRALRYSLRLIFRNKTYAGFAIAILACGIGANTIMFSVVNSVILRRLPYHDPSRLVWITKVSPKQHMNVVFDSEYKAWAAKSRVLEGVAAYGFADMDLKQPGGAERVKAGRVTANFFPVLGVQPGLGRMFSVAEEKPGGTHVVILNHPFRENRFAGSSDPTGGTLTLNDAVYTIVGVMPAGFRFPGNVQADLIVPFGLSDMPPSGRPVIFVNSIVARLRNGVASPQVVSELTAIDRPAEATLPPPLRALTAGAQFQVVPLKDAMVSGVRLTLLVMAVAVGFLLLVACANVASLQLARTVTRQREIAMKRALGASWWNVTRELLFESVALAIAGGAAGLLLAWWGCRFLPLLIRHIPQLQMADIRIDLPVLIFATASSLLAGILFGLAPLLFARKIDCSDAFRAGGGDMPVSGGSLPLHQVLVAAQLTLSMVLLAGSFLLVKSFFRLISIDVGFDPRNIVTAQVSLPRGKYRESVQRTVFVERLMERLQELPGVASAGAGSTVPIFGFSKLARVETGAGAAVPELQAGLDLATPAYFASLRIPLTGGRLFTDRDTGDSPPVAIVNQSFARTAFPGENVLGKRIRIESGDPVSVVGVIGDVRHFGITREPSPQVFLPFLQRPEPHMMIAIRTVSNPTALLPAIRAEIANLDKDVPAYDVRLMQEVMADALAPYRLNTLLLGSFSILAVIITASGVCGVTSYLTSRRMREVGIRMALGAERGQIERIFIRQMFRLSAIALIAGLLISLGLVRTLSTMLYNVSPFDPSAFAAAAVLVTCVALLASYVPALNAARLDPAATLRHQ